MKGLHLARLALASLAVLACTACDVPGSSLPAPSARATVTPPATAVPSAPPPAGSMTPICTAVPGASANPLESQVEVAYQRAAPSVVNITSQSFAYNMFRQLVPQEGTGSGFFFDDRGHIVTNYHVIEDAENILVTLASGETYTGTVVGQDPSTDLAVILISTDGLPPALPLDDSSTLRVGEFVLALGSPFSLQQTLTLGIISALERVIESPDGTVIAQAIQTDASINPGNSGGPLLNLDGAVVGVNTQIIGVTGANVGIGFAIASNLVAKVVPVLIARGTYPHPTLALSSIDISPAVAEILRQVGMNVPVDQGLLVLDVEPGGPADNAGIRGAQRTVVIGRTRVGIDGDIITAVDDQPIGDFQDLSLYLETMTRIGQEVTITYYRDGEMQRVKAALTERAEPGPSV